MAKEKDDRDLKTVEKQKWADVSSLAESALDFHLDFLDSRMGANHKTALDATARARLLRIIRAVSWVESKHGTVGANQPERDPMQCGNPADAWWRELTGQSGNGSRFIRGPKHAKNFWASELAAGAEGSSGFPSSAELARLCEKTKGHSDSAFAHAHSYYWGVVYLIHRINTTAGDKSYQCGDLSRDRLVNGAKEYNGGGVPDYKDKINDALQLIGDLSKRLAPFTKSSASPEWRDLVGMLEEISHGDYARDLTGIRLEWGENGELRAAELGFAAP